jgi:hypothetical protein
MPSKDQVARESGFFLNHEDKEVAVWLMRPGTTPEDMAKAGLTPLTHVYPDAVMESTGFDMDTQNYDSLVITDLYIE